MYEIEIEREILSVLAVWRSAWQSLIWKCYQSIRQGNDTPRTHGSSRPRSYTTALKLLSWLVISAFSLNIDCNLVLFFLFWMKDDTCSCTGPCNVDQKFLKEKHQFSKVSTELKTNVWNVATFCSYNFFSIIFDYTVHMPSSWETPRFF